MRLHIEELPDDLLKLEYSFDRKCSTDTRWAQLVIPADTALPEALRQMKTRWYNLYQEKPEL